MQTFQADLAVIGAGGAGLRAAIAAAQANPNAKIALISKVYPMRSHTVAAEGVPLPSRRIMIALSTISTILLQAATGYANRMSSTTSFITARRK